MLEMAILETQIFNNFWRDVAKDTPTKSSRLCLVETLNSCTAILKWTTELLL